MMRIPKFAGEIMSALLYCQVLLVFAGVASVLMHGEPQKTVDPVRPAVEASQPL